MTALSTSACAGVLGGAGCHTGLATHASCPCVSYSSFKAGLWGICQDLCPSLSLAPSSGAPPQFSSAPLAGPLPLFV